MTAPRPLHDRALDNLQFIRSTMERAGSFTAMPGWGMVVLGLTALVASAVAGALPVAPVYGASQSRWLWVWMFEALLGAGIGVAALLYKAMRAGDAIVHGPARRFGLSVLPPFFVGALLTYVLWQAKQLALLPAVWMLCYGAGVGRSEEGRVGEEGRSRWAPDHLKKKKEKTVGKRESKQDVNHACYSMERICHLRNCNSTSNQRLVKC